MIPISALLPDDLAGALQLTPSYRGRQIFSWIHDRLVFELEEMSDLPAGLRQDLAHRALPMSLSEDAKLEASDGSIKFRYRLLDGKVVESVILRDRKGRATACLSTQVGCAMGCRFCRTGTLGFSRDLEAHEIVEQFLLLRAFLRGTDGATNSPDRAGAPSRATKLGRVPSITPGSIVFMGMGEPLANLDNLQRAVEVLSFGGFSPRRITVSTCGLVDGIRALGERKLAVRLAVSLISADSPVRNELMPIARSNPLSDLRRALEEYQDGLGKRITLEIVLMDGINDRSADIEALVRFVHGDQGRESLKVLINLIPWNPLPDFPYQRPKAGRVEWFQRRIQQAGIPVTTRISRGSAVSGACGQLG